MKDIFKRFNAAPWPQKIVFVLGSPFIVALGVLVGVLWLIHFSITSAYEILTGDELYD